MVNPKFLARESPTLKREARSKLELPRAVDGRCDLAEDSRLCWLGQHRGHVRDIWDPKLRPIAYVVGRDLEAYVAFFAEREVLVEGNIEVLCSHSANVVKICRSAAGDEWVRR